MHADGNAGARSIGGRKSKPPSLAGTLAKEGDDAQVAGAVIEIFLEVKGLPRNQCEFSGFDQGVA
jgi:hypothetical protein